MNFHLAQSISVFNHLFITRLAFGGTLSTENISTWKLKPLIANWIFLLGTPGDEKYHFVLKFGFLSGSSTEAQKLKRTETMKALQRRATDYHRRKSLRPNRKSSKNKIGTINEDEDEEDGIKSDDNNHLKVVRTKTYEDPEHLDERDV